MTQAFTRIGPGGGGGQLRPLIHPSNPKVLFITCDMTGWYQSTNGGETWRNINLKGVVRSAAFDPNRRRVIYAGNSGLYRSSDLGRTWALIFPAPEKVTAEIDAFDHADHRYESSDNWPGGRILGIAIDPADSRIIHLAIYRPAGDGGELLLFTSADDGRAFAPLARIDGIDPHGAIGDNHAVKFLYVDPDSPPAARRLYVATPNGVCAVDAASGRVESLPMPDGVSRVIYATVSRDASRQAPIFYFTSPTSWLASGRLAGGVYRSDDRGRSWRHVHDGLLDCLHNPGRGEVPVFTCIAAAPADPDVVYLECRSHPERPREEAVWGHPFGVFKTMDGGRRWSWCYRVAWDEPSVNTTRSQWLTRWYSSSHIGTAIQIAVAPSDPDIVWRATAMCSHRSTDGGRTWQETYSRNRPDGSAASNGMDVTTCYGVHVDPHVPRRIFISYTDIGLFKSEDGGKGWWLTRGDLPIPWQNTCYWMVFDPDVRDRMWSVWAGTHDLPRPKMFGGDWSRRLGGVAFSGDGGRYWHPVTTGMPDHSTPTHILLDPESPASARRLYVAAFSAGVYRSDNNGRSWRLMNRGLDPANLFAWRLTRAENGALYLCVARGGEEDGREIDGAVYRSADRAESWERVAMPQGTNAPNELAVDPRDPKRLYLACWPRTADARPQGGGVWCSRDAGRTWRNLLDERLHCYSVTVDAIKPDRLYVTGFNSAIFRSDDAGKSWRRLGGFNFRWAHRVIPDPNDRSRIYVTTFGGSVFHGPAAGTGARFEDIQPIS